MCIRPLFANPVTYKEPIWTLEDDTDNLKNIYSYACTRLLAVDNSESVDLKVNGQSPKISSTNMHYIVVLESTKCFLHHFGYKKYDINYLIYTEVHRESLNKLFRAIDEYIRFAIDVICMNVHGQFCIHTATCMVTAMAVCTHVASSKPTVYVTDVKLLRNRLSVILKMNFIYHVCMYASVHD